MRLGLEIKEKESELVELVDLEVLVVLVGVAEVVEVVEIVKVELQGATVIEEEANVEGVELEGEAESSWQSSSAVSLHLAITSGDRTSPLISKSILLQVVG